MILPNHILEKMNPNDRASLGKAGRTKAECKEQAEAKSEKQIQGQIEGLLRRNNVWFVRQRMDKKTSQRCGVPDFLLCVRGRFVAWEVKCGLGKTRPEQDKELEMIRLSGGRALVIRSYDEAKLALYEMIILVKD